MLVSVLNLSNSKLSNAAFLLEFSGFYILFNLLFSKCLYILVGYQDVSAEGGIWTLAPLLTAYSLSRGAPSATWVLLQLADLFLLCNSIINLPTERVGFEPTRPCGQTVFKTASLWPLRYLSVRSASSAARTILAKSPLCVNNFLQIFFNNFYNFLRIPYLWEKADIKPFKISVVTMEKLTKIDPIEVKIVMTDL